MTVIGIDTHKDMLAACLINMAGRPVEHRTIPNMAAGFEQLTTWAERVNVERVAIEGSGNFGRPTAIALIDAGIEVVEVPPQMTAGGRKQTRTNTRTDKVDALLVARIGLRDDDLPPPRPIGTRHPPKLDIGAQLGEDNVSGGNAANGVLLGQ